MGDEFDINAVAAAFLQQNLDRIVEAGKEGLKAAKDRVRLQMSRTYYGYLTSVLEKYSRAKSFLIRADAVYLYQFYVPLSAKHHNRIIERPSASDIEKVGRCAIVIGSAGSGKSMFVRHLLVNSVLAKTRIPVLIELRQFNQTDEDLKSLIYRALETHKFPLDKDYIEKALMAGHFYFLVDGYDEVVPSKRAQVGQ
jgi:hypothetical protein